MKIDIICPLYNAEKYILDLNKSLLNQNIKINKIHYILTKSSDNTENILKENKINYKIVEKFSHSLTREEVALKSKSDILVFITQDIKIKDNKWLYYLTKPIIDKKVEATFSRQISEFNNIEKYTREKNYPIKSYIVSKKDIKKLGLKTFFFSDASSAIKTDIFKELKGYDGRDLPTNEDMYFAYKLIQNDYKIKYESKSIIYHSHNFKLKDLYKRYYDTGLFFKENDYLNNYNTNKSGMDLALYILKRSIKELNFKVILRYPFDMLVRFIAMKRGKHV